MGGNLPVKTDMRSTLVSLCLIFKLAGGEQQLCCLRTASPQGIAALAAQGGVATLTERSDETFTVEQFSSADRE